MSNAWKRVREQNRATLYADNEPYAEYMKRMLSESVQYKPKEKEEENIIEKYMNYEVKEEKNSEETENDKKLGFTGEILAVASSLLFFGGVLGVLIWVIVTLSGG